MADEPSEERIDFPDYPPLDETGTVDVWQIEANLALTPAQRIKQFEGFLELCDAMRRAGIRHYDDLPPIDPETA